MHLSQALPWVGSPPDAFHRRAAESIIGLWVRDAELGDHVARMAWVVDGVTDDEPDVLSSLRELAASEPELAGLLLRLPWVVGMPADTAGNVEWIVFGLLSGIGVANPPLARLLASHPLLADDLTLEEWQVVELLVETGFSNLEQARRLAATDWVSDGIEAHELPVLFAIVSTADSPTASAEFLSGIPGLTAHLPGDLPAHATRALANLALDGQGHLEQIRAQPWFADGLTEEEAVLVVILERAADDLPAHFRDLLTGRFSRTRTVEFPLTGEVRLWVVQDTPLSDGDVILQDMEETVRYLEEVVQEPFPTDVLILSVVDPNKESYGLGGEWLNTHIRLARNPHSGSVEEIPHEAGHFIFKGPRWYSEGASELGRAFVNHRTGVQTLDQRREELANTERCTSYANIRHWAHEVQERGPTPGDLCPYILGENLLLNAWNLLGQDNMSATLRELYVLNRDKETPITEEVVYDAFLRNVPSGKQAAFQDLYRRLHGGAFAFPGVDLNDAHGDDPANAGVAEVGRGVTGALDYMFDFDYFRFQAQADQKYRITVAYPSLPPDWVTVYAPDGVTRDAFGLKSSSVTPSGPELLWIAPGTGEYFLAVRNFGGLTGNYTLSIDPVEDVLDDHGDTAASATSLTPGQTTSGAVDDEFDLDYFRFQAAQGQWVHVEVQIGTLEFLSAGLYEADGTTPALQRPEDMDTIVSNGGTYLHVIDLMSAAWSRTVSFDWVAPHAGEFFLAVSGAHGRVGSYSVTITTPER